MRFFVWTGMFVMVLCSNALILADESSFPVKALENRRFHLLDRFHLDLQLITLPLDGFYKPLVAEASASYQFNEWITIEGLRFGLSLVNIDTGLKRDFERKAQKALVPDPVMKDFRFYAGSNVYLNLLYSKSSFFNKKILYHEWMVGGGPLFLSSKRESQLAIELGLKVRFYLDEDFSLTIKGAHAVGIMNSDAPMNFTILGLGVGYAF